MSRSNRVSSAAWTIAIDAYVREPALICGAPPPMSPVM
jgi:hypothetical protein